MELRKPVLILALDHEDSYSMMAGVLWMKGCEVYKAKAASDYLAQLERLDSQVDVVVVTAKIALDRNAMLIVRIKRLDMNIKILAIGDEVLDRQEL